MKFTKATYKSDYIIEIEFDNGSKKLYDFRKWLFVQCQPFYRIYRDLNKFKKFKIIDNTLTWGEGSKEMDFLPYHLKEFEITRMDSMHRTVN